MTSNRTPHVIVLRFAAVLLILVMLSTSMIAGRYARYTTTATGSDSARVAKFEVTETSDLLTQNKSIAISIIPGGTDRTEIKVNNASEVSVQYRIDVDNPYANFPLDFNIQVGEATSSLPFVANLKPGEEATYVLVTTWNSDDRSLSYSGKVDLIEIYLSATQID